MIVKGADDPGVNIAVAADAGDDNHGVRLRGGNDFRGAAGGQNRGHQEDDGWTGTQIHVHGFLPWMGTD